jgi:hypothetical protein
LLKDGVSTSDYIYVASHGSKTDESQNAKMWKEEIMVPVRCAENVTRITIKTLISIIGFPAQI